MLTLTSFAIISNKIAGNIHVALGTTRKINGQVVHSFVQDQLGEFNTSHIISHMRFGEENQLGQEGQLDNISRYVDPTLGKTAAMQYFVHLIPVKQKGKIFFRFTKTSKYIPILQPVVDESLVANTDSKKYASSQGPKGMGNVFTLPGVYFMYDFSPFVIVREPYQIPLIDLITDLLTVAGGVFALVRLLDSALHFVDLV